MPLKTAARWAALVPVVIASLGLGSVALAQSDFGSWVQSMLQNRAPDEFGVEHPLERSSELSISAAEAQSNPLKLVTLAQSLHATVVTSTPVAQNIDMISLWPDDTAPTHLIACNEGGVTDAGLIRVDLATGQTDVIVTGTTSCDPTRRTPWGTIVFGEEAGGGPNGGRIYELIDPLHTTGVLLNRASGTFSGGVGFQNLTARLALGRLSFEGLGIYPNGVVYYADENRPSNGTPGGAYFKFVPSTLRDPASEPITSLSQSPLTAGSTFGLRLGLRSGGTDYGQGTQTGFGRWVPVASSPDADLRAQSAVLKLTGFYRPEDLDIDQAALAKGLVRWCGNNTGNESDGQNYGETVCLTDGTLSQAAANTARPEMQYFVVGSPEFAMPDNVAYQPGRANWVIHEDADAEYLRPHNDDLWDCLADGADDNLLSDGCIRVGTLNDLTAEWTGGIFDASGSHFYVSVQHNISGRGVILDITGWR